MIHGNSRKIIWREANQCRNDEGIDAFVLFYPKQTPGVFFFYLVGIYTGRYEKRKIMVVEILCFYLFIHS